MGTHVSDPVSSLAQNRKNKNLILLLIGLSVIGFGLSLYLADHFYALRDGTAPFRSSCNLGGKLNCDVVTSSRFGELFWGIPVAALAAGWFAAVFFVSLAALGAFWRRESVRILFALTSVGSVFSIAYLVIMLGVLNGLCVFCLGIDLLVFASLGITLLLKPLGIKNQPFDRGKFKTVVLLTAGSLLTIPLLLKVIYQVPFDEERVTQFTASILAVPPISLPQRPEGPSFGPRSAPITVIEFSDFQCPFCRIGASTLNSVLARYPDLIRVEFRNFPLDNKCNPELSEFSPHPYACESAKAALCAHQQGKFEPAYQLLFENQRLLGTKKVSELIADSGVDLEKLERCIASDETSLLLQQDMQDAQLAQIRSTPIFFVNGYRIEGVMPLPIWIRLMDHLLANQAEPTHAD